jgi:STE24 endopeptidase
MNASKRSARLNAFFSGFGKFKHIVLYDTLLEKCGTDEIVAVLAHEIGHARHKDVLRNFFISMVQISVYLLLLTFFLSSSTLARSFGFEQTHLGFALILFAILAEPFGILLGIPLSAMSRTAEFRADRFAAQAGYQTAMISALKILARENFSNLTPHPAVVKMTYSHPPVSQRIEALVRECPDDLQ